MEWWYTVITGLLGLLGGVIGARLVSNFLTLRSGNYAISKTQRADAINELQDIIKQLRIDVKDQKDTTERIEKELEVRAKAHTDCEIRCALAEARIEVLEDTLTAAGIKHRPWKRGQTNSGSHPLLPPEEPHT